MPDRPILLRDLDALEPLGKPLGDVFLEKSLRVDSGRVSFHGDGTAADVRQHHGGDRFVVRRELAFGDPIRREQHFLRMGDHDDDAETEEAGMP